MRTTAVLLILLLVVGLNLGASVALAGDHSVIQPLPSACQPVSDVELSQMRGKFIGWGAHDVSVPFTDFITHDAIDFRQRISYRTTPGVAAGSYLAAAATALGGPAQQLTASYAQVSSLITAGSYLADLGFRIGAILKFK